MTEQKNGLPENPEGFWKSLRLSSDALKLIAMVTMLIDHATCVLVSGGTLYYVLRGIGRLAFPIYCLLLAEGFLHTRDYKKYLARMAVFALISELPFDLAIFGRYWYPNYQNVGLTLFFALAGLGAFRWCTRRQLPIYAILAGLSAMAMAYLFNADYGAEGVLLVFLMYLLANNPTGRALALIVWSLLMGGLETAACFAIVPILCYSGEKGKGGALFSRLSYGFYPLHLVLLGLIRLF